VRGREAGSNVRDGRRPGEIGPHRAALQPADRLAAGRRARRERRHRLDRQPGRRRRRAFLGSLVEDRVRALRYAPDKWTLKEVLGHIIIDDERVFAYRAFCLARGETTPLPGFDEKIYARHSDAENRLWVDLLDEYRVVRAATIALFRSLAPGAWTRTGEVNGYRATPRGLAFHIAGHELHHLRIVRERYLSLPARAE
jgi:hypothetical protein